VEGRSAREVRDSVNANRPVAGDGRGRDASTTWTYNARWRTDASGACVPATTEVTYAFVVTLPELGPEARLRGESVSRWNDWTAYLAAHERRRIDGMIAGFQAMQASMRAAPDCAAMTARQAEALAAMTEQGRGLDAALAEQYRRNPRRLPTFP
jgi:predicted secreted Zn-dependent protease